MSYVGCFVLNDIVCVRYYFLSRHVQCVRCQVDALTGVQLMKGVLNSGIRITSISLK